MFLYELYMSESYEQVYAFSMEAHYCQGKKLGITIKNGNSRFTQIKLCMFIYKKCKYFCLKFN